MDRLELLLHDYQRQLYAEAGIDVHTRMIIEHRVILRVVEEMFGIEGGGQNLGDALEQWLSLPPENRKPVQFADLKAKWDAQEQDIRS